jgi:hypothetical protein
MAIATTSRERRLKTSSRARAAISIARRAIGTGEGGCDGVVRLLSIRCKRVSSVAPRRMPISMLGSVGLKPHGL